MNNSEVTSKNQDHSDAAVKGKTKAMDEHPEADMCVSSSSENYNMSHKKRGKVVILAYENYGDPKVKRECARYDAELCETTFRNLGYEVDTRMDLTREKALACLDEVSKDDHTDSDSLVVIFMGHGGVYQAEEFVNTYDAKIATQELWLKFTPEKCPTLAGKPKMFFIQACRGEGADTGVTLSVQVDSVDGGGTEENYVIPLYADMLMMWASYPGYYAFRSNRNPERKDSSVFLRFLTQVLDQYAKTEDLSSMMIRVTREVATQYQAELKHEGKNLSCKQIPQTVSTLMRRVYFNKIVDNA